ncbi:MAG: phosphosulfolactate synthase [Nitrospirae bacterium]|nr:phosphosulfolactate synthase [Nitrospirota bacterium]
MTLRLPVREIKKRTVGRTQILDKGLGSNYISDQLKICGDYIDLAKLGWGTAVVSKNIEEKINIYKKNDIEVSLGGTLFEVYYVQNKIDEYISYLKSLDISTVEISDGVVEISRQEKLKHMERFKKDFRVFTEIGSKDVKFVTPPSNWVRWIKEELEAGADYVILEGRESGTVGLYRETGEIRMGLVNEIIESGINPDTLVFEAPRKPQQVWFIERLGPNVNLANVPIEDVISLETLRQGLRADTLMKFHAAKA